MQRECKHLCFHWVVLVDWMVRKEAVSDLQMCKARLQVSESCQSVWLNSDNKEQKRHRRKVYSVEEGI